MVPDFLHGAPPTDVCAAFIKESRMKFVNARDLDRKSGCTLGRTLGEGHPSRTNDRRWKIKSARARQPNLDSFEVQPSLRDWI